MNKSKLLSISKEITKRLKERKLNSDNEVDEMYLVEPFWKLYDWMNQDLWDEKGKVNPYSEEERMMLCDKKVFLFLKTFDREVLETIYNPDEKRKSTLFDLIDGSFGVIVGFNFGFKLNEIYDNPEQFDTYVQKEVIVKCPELVLQD